MNQVTDATERSQHERPAFLVGITGFMNLAEHEIEPLKVRVRRIFRFLREGPSVPDRSLPGQNVTLLESLIRDLLPEECGESRRPWWLKRGQERELSRLRAKRRGSYINSLSKWVGLKDTPVIVLTSLAPGADSLVAEVALEVEFSNFEVRAPLPFPHLSANGKPLYRRASTFTRTTANHDDVGDAGRKTVYDKLIVDIEPEKTFHVLLEEDLLLSPSELEATLEADLEKPQRRRIRYYAAGEFIAVNAHLLLAIWDGEFESAENTEAAEHSDGASGGASNERPVGTSAIVEARLCGPRPGVLPLPQGLSLPHGGPLIHLFAHKVPSGKETAVTAAEQSLGAPDRLEASQRSWPHRGAPIMNRTADERPPPPMRILHPPVFARPTPNIEPLPPLGELVQSQPQDARLQAERLSMFRRISYNLNRFNLCVQSSVVAREDELNERLTYLDAARQEQQFGQGVGKESLDFSSLRRISDVRRTAADANRPPDRNVKRTLCVLFWVTFLAATLLHVYAHWHAQSHARTGEVALDAADHDAPDGQHSSKAADANVKRDHGPQSNMTPASNWESGVMALGLAAVALAYFAIKHALQPAERAHDYRAIAEGFRVQFYWDLAGIGRSVSSSYMQRQLSELDWIRGAIRSVALTSEQSNYRFAKSRKSDQVAAMRCAQCGWILHQLGFFEDGFRSHHHRLHAWHKLGGAAALAGIWTFAVLIAYDLQVFVVTDLVAHPIRLIVLALFMIAMAATTGWLVRLTSPSHHDTPHSSRIRKKKRRENSDHQSDSEHQVKSSEKKPLIAQFWKKLVEFAGWLLKLVDFLVPKHESGTPGPSTPVRLFVNKVFGLLAFLPISLALCGIALCLCHLLSFERPTMPSFHNLGIIVGGVFLLGGALAVAWAEKNLLSELAYQYNTMASLFRNAAQRIAHDIHRLEQSEEDSAEYKAILSEMQKFLFALGKEALDENAEWLLLHRARPLEPVMAG